MSAIPISEAGYPPLRRLEGATGRLGRVSRRLMIRAGADLRNAPRYVLRYAVIVLAVFGLLSLWEAQGDGRIPGMLPLRTIDPRQVSAPQCAALGAGDEARWQGLAPALAILDQVNPQVASWLRQKHDEGRVVFSDNYGGGHVRRGSLAEYDYFRRTLVVHRTLFEENDGEVAAILCHEYRHSRQNLARLFKYALSFVVTADGDPSIVESDALLFEREARDAIFAK